MDGRNEEADEAFEALQSTNDGYTPSTARCERSIELDLGMVAVDREMRVVVWGYVPTRPSNWH